MYLLPLSTAVYNRLRTRDKSLPSQLITWNEGIHHGDSWSLRGICGDLSRKNDWFINSEWAALYGGVVLLYRILLSLCGEDISSEEVLTKCPPQQRTQDSGVACSAHYLAGAGSRPEVEKGTLWEQNRSFPISLAPCLPSGWPHYGTMSCDAVIYGNAQRHWRWRWRWAKFLPLTTAEGQKPCKFIMRKRQGLFRDTSVSLTFNLSKGGKDSRMHGLCRHAGRKPSASGFFLRPLQIALQRMNASAHPRALWCENEVRWSVLLLGAGENGRTIDQQKQLVFSKSGAKSSLFPVLCLSPAAPEVPSLWKFLSSSLKSVRWF